MGELPPGQRTLTNPPRRAGRLSGMPASYRFAFVFVLLSGCRGAPSDAPPPPAAAPTPPCAKVGDSCRLPTGVLGVCEPQGTTGGLHCMSQH